ncbi:MAG: hypothetical protein K8J08_13935 [Thermoanaerobaculia bacterium]|nr:hypothetical protein [Thermoanaerobaculia bacterium]
MDDGSRAIPWTGWNRGLQGHPEQPVLFFLRGGQWRWWSYRELATAGARVAAALSGPEAEPSPEARPGHEQRVSFQVERSRHSLAIDLAVRTLGRVSAPEGSVGAGAIPTEVESLFRPPELDKGAARGGCDPMAELRPMGSVEVKSPEGPQVWTAERLASGVSALATVLARVPEGDGTSDGRRERGVKERPVALAAGTLERLEERLWVEWAADRDAVLVLVESEDALPWATSWIRPHYVLGGLVAARAALAFALEHEGSGRWARRFRRLERWVLSRGEEGAVRSSSLPPDLVAGWGAREVTLTPFFPKD